MLAFFLISMYLIGASTIVGSNKNDKIITLTNTANPSAVVV